MIGSHKPDAQIPGPSSVWPMVLAAGITAVLFGLVMTTIAFAIVGSIAMVIGIVGWLREL